jgi:hypothetical protein
MQHDKFAQLCDFTRKSEDYSFDSRFHLNKEQVLVGSTATILITPALKINGRRAELNLLQEIVVTVKT